jgi:formate dehydrogenase subunit gamma
VALWQRPLDKGGTMKAAAVTYIRRFSWCRIAEHWLVAVIFLFLMATGFIQKYHDLSSAQWIVLHLGGIDAVRLVHRTAGIILIFAIFQHILVAVSGVIFKGWSASMLITKSDFTDAIENLKYYFGIVDSPARCGRYSYRQKFEYWGILTGSVVMSVTGMALWFPAMVTRVLPGEFIPVAKLLHTNEALVLVLVVAVWHIYNAIFSPEVFPMDTVMLNGKISVERMILEHPKEYEEKEEPGDQRSGVSFKEEDFFLNS